MTHYVLPETKARLDYDKGVKGLYIAVAGLVDDETVVRTETVNDSPLVNFDYDKDDKLVGIEVLLP